MALDYTLGYWPNSDIGFMHEMESHKGLKSKKITGPGFGRNND